MQVCGWGCPSSPGWAPVLGVCRHPSRCATVCLSWRVCVEPLGARAPEHPGYGNLRSLLPMSCCVSTHLSTYPCFCMHVEGGLMHKSASVHLCTPSRAHGEGLRRWVRICITEMRACTLGCLQKDVSLCMRLWKHAGMHVCASWSVVYLSDCFPSMIFRILSSFTEFKGREQMVHQSAT